MKNSSETPKFRTIIEPQNGWFDLHLKELVQYRDLIFLFVKRNFVAQYKQTILGPVWAIVQPLLTTVVFTLIFGNIAGLSADGVPSFIFYLSGTILWTYFNQCLTQTANTFVANRQTLGKVYFPRLVMPISTVFSNLISLAIQFGFMVIFLIYYVITNQGCHPNLYILMTPLIILQLALLSLGCGIIISALTTKYRDLAMLVGFGAQLWMYASPIAYDMNSMAVFAVGGKYHTPVMLNPITPIVNLFRYAYLGLGEMEWAFYGISWLITLVVLFIGIILFSKVEKTFMDTV